MINHSANSFVNSKFLLTNFDKHFAPIFSSPFISRKSAEQEPERNVKMSKKVGYLNSFFNDPITFDLLSEATIGYCDSIDI